MLNGKTALVTGSTSGIGLAVAKTLAAKGAKVMLNGLGDPAEIEKIRAQIAADHGVEVDYHGADLTKPEQIEDMIKATVSKLGSIDILINNAGIQHVSPIEDFPPEKWNAIIAINLTSAYYTIHYAFKAMKDKGWGRIVNMGSAHALVASPFKSAYVAAKHGILGLTKTIALEGAEYGVTCNCVCPGYVLTPFVEKQIPDTAKARGITEEEVIKNVLLAAQPTKKFVEEDDIAETFAFLCSDAGRSITGTHISIDGGWTA